ncbi:flagellar protein FlgN [Geomonas subterranea]|uniref:Flagellar protein FlgN n=1 Tax=Geomonas subterranea TaxID=2847989 RepID=A0ABX8LG70_9BACT|nr:MULTISPECIES: flagellar protein FlgN [Geomonas]QXE90341.1 flagellar protein FlgN [Geomonas subterranea]QXM07534.1 flagellar protein FlgN [Geomonas subterranea]
MDRNVVELIAALCEKGVLLDQMQALLQEEQECMASLDMARMEENQQEITAGMERLARLSGQCQGMIAAIGADLGMPGESTLSPIIERLGAPEKQALKEAQDSVTGNARALHGALALHRRLIEDSLNVVGRSVNFFNRLFNPGQTYGGAGAFVNAGRGASGFVSKEI